MIDKKNFGPIGGGRLTCAILFSDWSAINGHFVGKTQPHATRFDRQKILSFEVQLSKVSYFAFHLETISICHTFHWQYTKALLINYD